MIRNEAERGWIAGLLEGEGCFTIRTDKRRRGTVYKYPVVSIHMTDKDVLDRFAGLVDHRGTYSERKVQKSHHKPAYHIRVVGNNAIELILTVIDLMGARRQARIRECLATAGMAVKDGT